MDLKKFLPGLEDKQDEEYFWALAIEPGCVQAGIWKVQEGVAQVLYTSPPNAWEVDDDLINACDAALSSAIQDFPEDLAEPSKTVFGVSYGWVSGGEIAPEYLEKIKVICKELSLTPVGFVVMPEALSHMVKSEEGTPLNGILLGAYKENLEISLFELGKLIGTTQVARSVSLVDDAVEGLTRLVSGETLPSRIMVYDGKEADLEESRQSLLKANWDDYEKLKFLHTPKIEILDSKKKVSAVALAGASEIANATELEMVNPAPKTELDKDMAAEDEKATIEETEGLPIADLGFAMDEDVALKEEAVEDELPLSDVTHEESNVIAVSDQEFAEPQKPPKKKIQFDRIGSNISGSLSFFKKLRINLPKIPRFPSGQKPLLIGVIIFLVLILLGGVWWWFFPKAVVTIYVSPQKLEERVNLNVAESGQTNVEERTLGGRSVETSVSGEKTKNATGSKVVGDKAKGEVTIYRVGSQLSLTSGTLLYGPGDLNFSLDNAVTIASGSASTPGVTKVDVSAEAIGAEYNLASGATFSVGNYSTVDMEAKNENAFSGGSSREISAVSEEDQEMLQEELEDELKAQIESELEKLVEAEEFFIKESQQYEANDIVFSHKVGDEASTLKLTMTLEGTALKVKKDELADLSGEALKDKVPQGFVLRGEQITYSFEDFKVEEEGKYSFLAKVSANLLPEVKTDELAKKIAGKYPSLAEEYLQKEAPGFVRTEIRFKPMLPGRLKTLPHLVRNIEVELSAER